MAVYNNPIVLQRADPWVLKVDGEYYFTASDPEYNCIAIRHASSINDLQKARPGIIEKLKSFGADVVSNIVANLLTNPAIWGGL